MTEKFAPLFTYLRTKSVDNILTGMDWNFRGRNNVVWKLFNYTFLNPSCSTNNKKIRPGEVRGAKDTNPLGNTRFENRFILGYKNTKRNRKQRRVKGSFLRIFRKYEKSIKEEVIENITIKVPILFLNNGLKTVFMLKSRPIFHRDYPLDKKGANSFHLDYQNLKNAIDVSYKRDK